MKKLIIVSHTMRLGGVERSLIGLLNSIDYSKYEVDLFLFLHDGEMMSLIPKEVNLLPQNKKFAGLISSVKENLKCLNLDILIGKRKARKEAQKYIIENHIGKNNLVYDNYLQKYNLPFIPKISEKEYDLAISFLTPHYIATEKIQAHKSIAWIHTDYSFFEFDKKAELEMWGKYDFIASISEDCTQGFIKQFPSLKEKIVLIENILHPDFIQQQAKVFSVEEEMLGRIGELKFLSVGRFSYQKNFDNVPEIAKKLIEKGLKFKWYLIGFGGEETLIRQKIAEHRVVEQVIILGKKDNPYPYMKAADVYLQLSRYEGKAVTVREAQILGKPVIITKFATSYSQLEEGVDGLIVPMENEACAEGIFTAVQNKELLWQLTKNTKIKNYGNEKEVEKVLGVIRE